RRDEPYPGTDAAGLGGRRDPRDDLAGEPVGDDALHFPLRQAVDRVLSAPVHLGVALLTAEAADLAHGHADDAGARERFLHVVEFKRLDDRLNLLHQFLWPFNASARAPSLWPASLASNRPLRGR